MDALFSFLAQVQAWHWFAFALVLLIAEIATGTTYLLWPAVAAATTGVLAFAIGFSWTAQLAMFAVFTLILTLTGHFYVRGRWLSHGGSKHLNERSNQLIGQKALADAPFAAGFGRVRIGDTVWRAASSEAIAPGEYVEIISVDGATLHLRKSAT